MRTLSDIVGAVQDQTPATEEELRLALLCLYYHGVLHSHYPDEHAAHPVHKARAKDEFEARFRRIRGHAVFVNAHDETMVAEPPPTHWQPLPPPPTKEA